VELSGGHTISGPVAGYNALSDENLSVSFELTDTSSVFLGFVVFTSQTDKNAGARGTSELLDSNGNVILSNSESALLPPGTYTLEASLSGNASGAYPPSGSVTDWELLGYIESIPVPTPEPNGTAGAMVLSCVIIGYIFSRRMNQGAKATGVANSHGAAGS